MLFEADPYTRGLSAKMWKHVQSSINRYRSQLSSLHINYKQGQGSYSIKCHRGSYNLPVKSRVIQVLVNRSLGMDWSETTLNDQWLYICIYMYIYVEAFFRII